VRASALTRILRLKRIGEIDFDPEAGASSQVHELFLVVDLHVQLVVVPDQLALLVRVYILVSTTYSLVPGSEGRSPSASG